MSGTFEWGSIPQFRRQTHGSGVNIPRWNHQMAHQWGQGKGWITSQAQGRPILPGCGLSMELTQTNMENRVKPTGQSDSNWECAWRKASSQTGKAEHRVPEERSIWQGHWLCGDMPRHEFGKAKVKPQRQMPKRQRVRCSGHCCTRLAP